MLRAYRLPRVRFPGCGRVSPIPRNRMRYFLSLMLFAVVSEVPWYLLNGTDGTHNVMFTLALGVAALAAFERLWEHRILCCCSILMTAWLAAWLEADYEWRGVLMIVVF